MREVVLIVSGVLIALSLEAMWQYRVDRSDEQALLEHARPVDCIAPERCFIGRGTSGLSRVDG
jgi:hypothetical protein